jgi:hypothetical protein
MKIFSTIIILAITVFSAKAQQTTKETYLTQPDLKRFTGEWQYVSHDTTFLINLKLVKTFIKGEGAFYIDLIQGDYTIKKGGQILQSSTQCSTIKSGGYLDKNISKDKLEFIFYDLGRNKKSCTVIFELVNGSPNTANWKLTNRENPVFGEKRDYTFSVPQNAVFKKIN